MITRRLVVVLGASQLVCWGISFYLIGIFGEPITDAFGWSMTVTYSGFSAALVVMGLTSGLVGRLIDRHGGAPVMTLGSLLLAAGCLGLSLSQGIVTYVAAWLCLGLAMRMTLYEAAFASVVRIGGNSAGRAISKITLLGGLASTVFWPVGGVLGDYLGWRGALAAYGAIALATIPLHRAIPDARFREHRKGEPEGPPQLARSRPERVFAGVVFTTLVTVAAFLNSGISAHMIGIMSGLGLGAGLAVWLSTLRGIGQSGARLLEVVFGAGLSPLALGLIASALLPLAFVIGLFSGTSAMAGAMFALGYGAGNGLMTLVRASQPLLLFGRDAYGGLVGRLVAPGFFASALGPMVFARVIETMGNGAALWLSAALGALVFACAGALWVQFGRS